MLAILKNRFETNPMRHPELSWESVERRLLSREGALR